MVVVLVFTKNKWGRFLDNWSKPRGGNPSSGGGRAPGVDVSGWKQRTYVTPVGKQRAKKYFSFFWILGVDMDDKECRMRESQGENQMLDEDYCDDDDCDYYEYDEWDYDGQPSEYVEWQDVYGGDDWDHGQYDNGEW